MSISSLSTNIKRLRLAKGWSQEELARNADILFTTFTKIENGTTKNPSIETLAKVASVLNVNVDTLISENNSETK